MREQKQVTHKQTTKYLPTLTTFLFHVLSDQIIF